MVDIASGGGLVFAWKVRSRAAPTVSRCFRESFYPHGRLSRFNELSGFLNQLFGAFDDVLPGFFV